MDWKDEIICLWNSILLFDGQRTDMSCNGGVRGESVLK